MGNPIHDAISKNPSLESVDAHNVIIRENPRVYSLEKLGNKQFFSKNYWEGM